MFIIIFSPSVVTFSWAENEKLKSEAEMAVLFQFFIVMMMMIIIISFIF